MNRLIFQQGVKYRVTWKAPHHRAAREFIAVFLSTNKNGDVNFSGRPQFGTSSLPERDILSIEQVPQSTPCKASA